MPMGMWMERPLSLWEKATYLSRVVGLEVILTFETTWVLVLVQLKARRQ